MRKIFALLLLLVTVSAVTVEGCGEDTPEIFVDILSPLNTTYQGTVSLEVVAMQNNSFLHNASVTAIIDDVTYTLPEGQNSYRSSAELDPGFYRANVIVRTDKLGCLDNVSTGAETGTASVDFTVSGELTQGNETIVYPSLKRFEIERISPTRARYMPGEQTDISVYLVDQTAERLAGATVTALVKLPDETEQSIVLPEKLVSGQPVYKVIYVFSQEGFHEIMITAEKEGYETDEIYMPPISIGGDDVVLPSDVFCEQGMCIRVESPSETETYPDGSNVEFRVQVVEESTAAPISDATAVMMFDNTTMDLGYDWNGYYYNTTYNMTEGNYLVTFQAQKDGIVLQKNVTLHVSPDQLVIQPINPSPGGNVTESFTTMQVRITDQDGEIVTGANVRGIVTTPLTGTRNVQLSRNTSSGYYESEYTFADPGQYTLKMVASKIGYVSSESIYTFDVVTVEKEGVQLTEQDVVIAALIIGVLLIIATLWRALL